jgi:acetolactate synthase regulatory subunit
MTTAAAAARSAGAERLLDVHAHDLAAVLLPVLTVLRRRGCQIRGVDFSGDSIHRPGRLRVRLVAPVDRSHCVAPWIENLVGVISADVS